MIDPKDILPELKNFKAHASEMERWAGKLIEKLEATQKPAKKRKGLTDEQLARITAKMRSKMIR